MREQSDPPGSFEEFRKRNPTYPKRLQRLEWLARWAFYLPERYKILKLLAAIGVPSLIVWSATWIMKADARKREAHERAWAVIDGSTRGTAHGDPVEALQLLNGDGVALDRVRLVGADLKGIDLSRARLRWAILDSADLRNANFAGADLEGASLVGAQLDSACLRGAYLKGTKLHGANLQHAALQQAVMIGAGLQPLDEHAARARLDSAQLDSAVLALAHLQWVSLVHADLDAVDLRGADLRHARLDEANLENADFTWAVLKDVSLKDIRNWRRVRAIEGALIFAVFNEPDGFIQWAGQMRASLDLDPDSVPDLVRQRQIRVRQGLGDRAATNAGQRCTRQ